MLVGDIFMTDIAAATVIADLRGRTAQPEQCAIRVTERVIAGIPVILRIIAVMTEIPAPLTLAMGADIAKILTHVRLPALVTGINMVTAILIMPAVFAQFITHSVVIRIANIAILIVQAVAQIVASIITALSITAPVVRIMENIFSAVPPVIIITALGRNVFTITFVLQAHAIKDADY